MYSVSPSGNVGRKRSPGDLSLDPQKHQFFLRGSTSLKGELVAEINGGVEFQDPQDVADPSN